MECVESDRAFSSLSQWLEWLETTRPETAIDLGLERVARVADRMGLTNPDAFVYTVGGTNGKGSTVALLEAVLLESGFRVGAFTSPHIFQFNERIRVSGESTADDLLRDSFARVDKARGDVWLTYFEFSLLVALDRFQREQVDVVLLEVGLGGRLDATNIIDADVSVITTVGLDHQDWLGDSLEKIAREKAGILRSGRPAVFGGGMVPRAVLRRAEEIGVPLYVRDESFRLERGDDHWRWSGIDSRGDEIELDCLPLPKLLLDNAAAALQALVFFSQEIDEVAIQSALKKVKLAGRFERAVAVNSRQESIDLILDVAHNPQAAERLAEELSEMRREHDAGSSIRALLGMYHDKDFEGVVAELGGVIDQWVVCDVDSPRSAGRYELQRAIFHHTTQVKTAETVALALQELLDISTPGDTVLVTGSFSTVAEVGRVLGRG